MVLKFDIHHAEATQTVSSTGTSVDQCQETVGRLAWHAEQVIAALPHSAVVAAGIQQCLDEVLNPTGQTALQQARSVTSNSSVALNAYAAGDQQMGQQGQTAASQVQAPDMPGVCS
ncbi:DUF6507 family protein [Nesterenkonia flava]|uniref:DUF6507 family protein n=1 Tax=Nesterenkonia flava TaxID=469799 RepID=A0ABU1FQR3_9MICC|nr:DUF6507 family protein [Nesterenkonia flava]MDR5710944.1 DUF6507 family protein [Nesterenkonia flava]